MRPGDTVPLPLANLFFVHNSLGLLILDPHPVIPHPFPFSLFDNSVLRRYYVHDDLTFAIAIQWFSHRALQ
jgi:hypothetical protein